MIGSFSLRYILLNYLKMQDKHPMIADVGTLKDGYVRTVLLLRAPRIQHASHTSHVKRNTCYLAQVPHIPTWSDLTRSLAELGRRALLPFPHLLV
jgi:hypothetical protein